VLMANDSISSGTKLEPSSPCYAHISI